MKMPFGSVISTCDCEKDVDGDGYYAKLEVGLYGLMKHYRAYGATAYSN